MFIDYDGKYFALRCLLDLGSTSFVISPEGATAFSIPAVKRLRPIKSGDVAGTNLQTKKLFRVPLGESFGNHRSYDEEDHASEVVNTSTDYNALIPAWYLEKQKARGTTSSHLHFPHCQAACCNHGKVHPEYSITYDKTSVLRDKPLHISAIVMSNPSVAQKLPVHYIKFSL